MADTKGEDPWKDSICVSAGAETSKLSYRLAAAGVWMLRLES